MEKVLDSQACSPGKEGESNEIEELELSLPREKSWDGGSYQLYQYKGFWYPSMCIHGAIAFQKHFQVQDTDIILVSFPKSGTTWLKALAFTIVNRSRYPLQDSPLLTTSPHELIPFVHDQLNPSNKNQFPNLDDLPKPRILATHNPYDSLPHSIMNSNCRIVYICRNPLDQFISLWHFLSQFSESGQMLPVEEAFEKSCNGHQGFGPFWKHILGYWKASLEQPHKILFLKYEDLKEDINYYVKRLADFLRCPFSEEEESQRLIEEISKLCSFDNLKNLEVNKIGKLSVFGCKKDSFFRKAQVGDWKNYITPSMAERLEKLMEVKFDGSGFTFKKL